jgi:hypothetical protein
LAPRLVGAWPTRRALDLLRPLFPSEKGVRLLGVTVSGFEETRGGTDQLGFCFPEGKRSQSKGLAVSGDDGKRFGPDIAGHEDDLS